MRPVCRPSELESRIERKNGRGLAVRHGWWGHAKGRQRSAAMRLHAGPAAQRGRWSRIQGWGDAAAREAGSAAWLASPNVGLAASTAGRDTNKTSGAAFSSQERGATAPLGIASVARLVTRTRSTTTPSSDVSESQQTLVEKRELVGALDDLRNALGDAGNLLGHDTRPPHGQLVYEGTPVSKSSIS